MGKGKKALDALAQKTWDQVLKAQSQQTQNIWGRMSGALGNEDVMRASDYVQALQTGYYKTPYGTAYLPSGADPWISGATNTGSVSATNMTIAYGSSPWSTTVSGTALYADSSGAIKTDLTDYRKATLKSESGSLRDRLLKEHEAFAGGVLRV